MSTPIPIKPGYYWAKLRVPADGTHEAELWGFNDTWEIVQVNANVVDWEDDPTEDEALSVAVPGVRETQWRECFVWGEFVAPLEAPDSVKTVRAPHHEAAEIRRFRDALRDIEFIVDGKADADDGVPNDAMKIEAVVRTALSSRERGGS